MHYSISDKNFIEKVKAVNVELGNELMKLSSNKKMHFIELSYSFGEVIFDEKGKWHLPNDENVRGLIGQIFNKPVFIVLSGVIERFVINQRNTIPLELLEPGDVFGLEQVFDDELEHQQRYQLCSGARTIFFLSKVSDQMGHYRLSQAFNMSEKVPRGFSDHWSVFKKVAFDLEQSQAQPWQTKLLFFSADWFEQNNCLSINNFHCYLLTIAWRNSFYQRHYALIELAFKQLDQVSQLEVKQESKLFCQRLLLEAMGFYPGLLPAIDDHCAPVKIIRDNYYQFYATKNNGKLITDKNLIIMVPGYVMSKTGKFRTLFNSFHMPTYFNTEKYGKRTNRLENIRECKTLLDRYLSAIREERINVDNTPLAILKGNLKIDFFHTKEDAFVYSVDALVEDFDKVTPDDGRFPIDSAFFKGCARITRVKNSKERMI